MGIGYLAQNKKNQSILLIINLIIQFFVETFVAIAIGYFLGKKLDELFFEDQAILVYIFLVFGIFAGLFNLIKRVLKNINGGRENEQDKHN